MTEFRPPIDNKIACSFAKTLLPLVLSNAGLEVQVSRNCLEKMSATKGAHTVLMVNHTDRFDPVSAFALSKACGEDFYYLAALEQFEANGAFGGWFMQQCGAYSVIRGEPADQVSRRTTISIISSGSKKLVMFPEGDVSGRDDIILPLKKDGLENILSAQSRLLDLDKPVFLLPVGIFYATPSKGLPLLIESVTHLEKEFLLHHGPHSSLQTRVETVVRAYVNHLEAKYGVVQVLQLPVSERLLGICRKEIVGIAETLGMEVGDEKEAPLLYSVRSKLRRFRTFCNCHYCKQLQDEENLRLKYLLPELDRLQQLLILASTIEQRPFTLEVAWRTLDRLQQLLNANRWKGVRSVRIEASEPIDLREFARELSKHPEHTLSEVEHLVQRGLIDCLQRSKAFSHPISLMEAKTKGNR